jgi:hypothetical protein
VTDAEDAENGDYFSQLGGHYAGHQPELDALLARSPAGGDAR